MDVNFRGPRLLTQNRNVSHSVVKYLNTQVFKYYLNTVTGKLQTYP